MVLSKTTVVQRKECPSLPANRLCAWHSFLKYQENKKYCLSLPFCRPCGGGICLQGQLPARRQNVASRKHRPAGLLYEIVEGVLVVACGRWRGRSFVPPVFGAVGRLGGSGGGGVIIVVGLPPLLRRGLLLLALPRLPLFEGGLFRSSCCLGTHAGSRTWEWCGGWSAVERGFTTG